MEKIKIESLKENAVSLFKNDWCLVTAGDTKNYNTMTASWGAMGELWGSDVCFVFIRPQRYTFEFMEKNDRFTVTFFEDEYKKALSFCGSKSGRDFDKAKETGLTPKNIDGSVSFEEGKIVVVCEKVYADDFNPEKFLDKNIDKEVYSAKDYHRMYVGRIISCYKK